MLDSLHRSTWENDGINGASKRQNHHNHPFIMPVSAVVNPYAKTAVAKGPSVAQNDEMGRQSQQPVSNFKRKYHLAGANNPGQKKKKGDQQTLFGERAFNSLIDCEVCKAKASNLRVPHRGHHQLCLLNIKTKGRGEISVLELAGRENEQRYQRLVRPIEEHEKGSYKNLTPEGTAAFFNPTTYARKKNSTMATPTEPTESTNATTTKRHSPVSPKLLCEAVTSMVASPDFCEKHKSKSAPLAMIAYAEVVAEKIIRPKLTVDGVLPRHFDNGGSSLDKQLP
jgi:hypothetical protein